MRDAHFDLRISPAVFDEASGELANALDDFKVPEREKGEVLAALERRARLRPVLNLGQSIGAAGVEPGVIRTAHRNPGTSTRRRRR
jgi:hypothetical protein